MTTLLNLLYVTTVLVCFLGIYIKYIEQYHSHWRFVATNWGFHSYVLFSKIYYIFNDRKASYSLELESMDNIFRDYVKSDYTNHNLSSAHSLLIQTRKGRAGFLKITLPPLYNDKIEYETISSIRVLWLNKHLISNGIIISLHGGAYVSGSCDSCLPYLSPLSSKTNMSGLSINYSLSPEVILPKQVNELFKIYKYLLENMNINSNDIILIGDSAGGSLLILFIQKLIKDYDTKYINKLPLCAVTMSSWDVPSNGNSYIINRNTDSLMDDKTGQIWGNFAVGNIDFDGKILIKDKKLFNYNLNNKDVSYLHNDNLFTFKLFPPLFLSVSQWECVKDDSIRVKNEMDKYQNTECVLYVTNNTGIHVLEDFYGHSIPEAMDLINREAEWILKYRRQYIKSKKN